jgi:hypothetical protein
VVGHVGQLFNEVATCGRTPAEAFVLVVVGGHHDNGGRQCATRSVVRSHGQVDARISVDVAVAGHGKAIVGTFPLGMVVDDLHQVALSDPANGVQQRAR